MKYWPLLLLSACAPDLGPDRSSEFPDVFEAVQNASGERRCQDTPVYIVPAEQVSENCGGGEVWSCYARPAIAENYVVLGDWPRRELRWDLAHELTHCIAGSPHDDEFHDVYELVEMRLQ